MAKNCIVHSNKELSSCGENCGGESQNAAICNFYRKWVLATFWPEGALWQQRCRSSLLWATSRAFTRKQFDESVMKIVVERVKMPQFAFFTDYPESELLQNVPNFFSQKERFGDDGFNYQSCGQHQELFLEKSLVSLWWKLWWWKSKCRNLQFLPKVNFDHILTRRSNLPTTVLMITFVGNIKSFY